MLQNEYCVRAPLRTGLATPVPRIDRRNYYEYSQILNEDDQNDKQMVKYLAGWTKAVEDKKGQVDNWGENQKQAWLERDFARRFSMFFHPKDGTSLSEQAFRTNMNFQLADKLYFVRHQGNIFNWVRETELGGRGTIGVRYGVTCKALEASNNTEVKFYDEIVIGFPRKLRIRYRGPLEFDVGPRE